MLMPMPIPMPLLATLAQLNAAFTSNPDSAAERAIRSAVEYALSELFMRPKFEFHVQNSAEMGKTQYRVASWVGRGPTYGEFAMVDLLQKGDFIPRAQTWLDQTYGPGFRVFYRKAEMPENTFNLQVVWGEPKGKPKAAVTFKLPSEAPAKMPIPRLPLEAPFLPGRKTFPPKEAFMPQPLPGPINGGAYKMPRTPGIGIIPNYKE